MFEKVYVHELKWGNTTLPIYYDKEYIDSELRQANLALNFLLQKIKEGSIKISEKNKKIELANDCINSSYIEGYQTSYVGDMLVDDIKAVPYKRAEKATLCAYRAYQGVFEEGIELSSIENIIKVWRKLVKYHIFMYKTIRIEPVIVGNIHGIVHKGPPMQYVRQLLEDMLEWERGFEKVSDDEFCLLKGIIAHYIFVYIHPFMDGNGRMSRLYEQYLIQKDNRLPVYFDFSGQIYKERGYYYASYQTAKEKDEKGKLKELNISEFIRFNLYCIKQSIIKMYSKFNIELQKGNILYYESIEKLLKYRTNIFYFDKKGVIENIGYEEYVLNLMQGTFIERIYNDASVHIKMKESEYKCK